MRVHIHVEPGRGRFRRAVSFLTFFLLVLCTRRHHHTTNITIITTTTTTSPHILVLIQVDDEEGREEQRKTQHRYYFCALCPYTNACAFFLSTAQRRNTNVYMMNIPFSLSLSPNSRSMMMMTIEIRANCAWWPCATSLIVWTNKAPCTSRCINVCVCRALAFINYFTFNRVEPSFSPDSKLG